MAAPRFFVPEPLAVDTRIALPAAVAHHARSVLRLRDGDPIVLFNGRGGEYRARLAGGPQAEVTGFDPVEREPAPRITLIQAQVASEKLDWVVEKAVEIGVARLIVACAARSTVRLQAARRERRLQHWRDLAIAACCQCGRNRPVEIETADSLAQALSQAGEARFRWVLDPAAAQGLPPAPGQPHAAALAVGPEGGFEPAELQAAVQAGFAPLRLGARVLRTETAGLAAAAAWLALNGEFS